MAEVMRLLSESSNGEAVIVADVGQHQMIAARYYAPSEPNSFITSGGLGTMGFALPAALGAKFAVPNRQVVAVAGDGGIQMNIQELATVAQEGIALKVVILNNNYLGMVRQWQEMFFERRYSFVEMKNPDFVKVADGFGVAAERIDRREELRGAIERLLQSNDARVLEIVVEREENVFPMVPVGACVSQMRLE
jgi:acetolactate synthase-1/2/3 large subunit